LSRASTWTDIVTPRAENFRDRLGVSTPTPARRSAAPRSALTSVHLEASPCRLAPTTPRLRVQRVTRNRLPADNFGIPIIQGHNSIRVLRRMPRGMGPQFGGGSAGAFSQRDISRTCGSASFTRPPIHCSRARHLTCRG
jgi:hypothetical protein